jgi:hypothetical protein
MGSRASLQLGVRTTVRVYSIPWMCAYKTSLSCCLLQMDCPSSSAPVTISSVLTELGVLRMAGLAKDFEAHKQHVSHDGACFAARCAISTRKS